MLEQVVESEVIQTIGELQVRRFGVPNRYHQHTSSVFVGARLDGLLAPPAGAVQGS